MKSRKIEGPVKVVSHTGALGAGVQEDHIAYGVSRGAHAFACDAGSTDSGPSYLARGVSKMPREAVRKELLIVMKAAHDAGVPLLVGSCGTSGTDAGVDWTCEIAVEVARELGITPKIALLYSEIDKELLKQRNAAGKVKPLPPMGALPDAAIDSCDHIVALMGPEPYIRALEQGADIVLGGRTTDTAVLAAIPIMYGKSVAASWHAGKIAECGGQCTVNPRTGGVIFAVDDNGFEIEPLNVANQCSPESVSAHMLYESTDPIRLTEPGGVLDVAEAVYEWADNRTTRVTGSRWEPMPYTMKLEGAGSGRYQSIMIIGIEDPEVLANLNLFHDGMLAALRKKIDQVFGEEAGDYDVSLRIYGWNGVSGRAMPNDAAPPHEVGVMFVVTAATQSLANRMAKACNPTFFHLPLRPGIEMPSYAFPFTPAEIERGQLYEFKLNHVVETQDAHELVRTRWVDLSQQTMKVVVNG
ncbi:3-methylaspartate ammonia-lyase [uncultured Defluviicoccus sp.]|uniref:3-methylaspartate ammonia-lyase n=1 Tax=metagenome TaxID=256318 RepID=A0A380T9I3_9ZZZZ|nr:3-methylaspartate ammonia-lyase [uncultured Defluviicoccus sp.]